MRSLRLLLDEVADASCCQCAFSALGCPASLGWMGSLPSPNLMLQLGNSKNRIAIHPTRPQSGHIQKKRQSSSNPRRQPRHPTASAASNLQKRQQPSSNPRRQPRHPTASAASNLQKRRQPSSNPRRQPRHPTASAASNIHPYPDQAIGRYRNGRLTPLPSAYRSSHHLLFFAEDS